MAKKHEAWEVGYIIKRKNAYSYIVKTFREKNFVTALPI